METKRRTILLLLALCLCLAVQAQMESRLTYRRYTTQDGLPQMQAERLWQDSHGYIYIGTLSGFVRFDGQTFTPFLKGRRTNIVGFAEVADEVRALGFFRQWTVGYDDLKAQPLDPQGHWLLNNLNAGGLPNGYVLLEDSLEQHRRLCRMTKQGFDLLTADPLLDKMHPDRKLYIDPEQAIAIIPTDEGVYRFSVDNLPSEQVDKLTSEQVDKLTDKNDIYTLVATDSTLLAFASDGLYSINDDSLRLMASADWTESSYGLTVRPLRSGHLIIADEHALYLYDGRTIRQIFSGINLIRDVLVDRWDRLWVASYQGVYCFFNRCFTNHWLTDENDIVRAVALDTNEQAVMGTLNGKVLVDGQLISDDPEQFYAPSAAVVNGNVYLVGNGDVARLDSTRTLTWLQLPRDRYQFVAKAWEKVIIGNRNSIMAYDPATAVTDTLTTEILHPWCAAYDDKQRLWIGSSSGLFCVDRAHAITKTEYPQKLIITTMEADSRGNIFFASADSVFIIRNGEVTALNPAMPALAGHEVRSLHVSPHGYVVVAVVDGLFVGRISDDYQIYDLRFFNQYNGFTMTEPLKASMAENSDGTVWIAGVEQMTSFRPADLLAYHEEDTYIAPPLSWWQHWWVWLSGLLLIALAVWAVTRWYEKRRNRRQMIRLQGEKLQKEQQIEAIRRKAIEAENTTLAQDIVRMTEHTADERLTFRTASGTIVVAPSDIAYFKGDGNYSQLVTFQTKDTVLMGLGALEKQLYPETFVRADRSTLVNIHNISQLLPKQHRCIFRSANGQELEATLLAPAFKRLQALIAR